MAGKFATRFQALLNGLKVAPRASIKPMEAAPLTDLDEIRRMTEAAAEAERAAFDPEPEADGPAPEPDGGNGHDREEWTATTDPDPLQFLYVGDDVLEDLFSLVLCQGVTLRAVLISSREAESDAGREQAEDEQSEG